ncbi:MAG: RNA pseudouridine synthase [Planctomycetes bacterium]|nr:RNA pseudouridine synthase [Planctomycetota bacterium]MCB9917540.1 RNA pseudouridine synthase [Planctomycetota bacterium]
MARALENHRFLWMDEHLGVVDKPAGILSTPAPGRSEPVLTDRIAAALVCRGEDAAVFAVHRLDEETTGSIAFARTEEARSGLEKIFKSHAAERVYHCIVHGGPRAPSGLIESRLDEDSSGIVRVTTRGGRIARTEYVVLLRLDGMSLLACRLETGRRNQIRVQLADIGCPVVGDRKYGRRNSKVRAKRTLLHATALGLTHPLTGARVEAVAPFPADFEKLVGTDRLAPFDATAGDAT